MAILSGFKSFERYLKVPTDDGNKYQLMSERTLAKDVIFDSDDNKNLETKMQEIDDKINSIKASDVTSTAITSIEYVTALPGDAADHPTTLYLIKEG